jgi:hypothetical protein
MATQVVTVTFSASQTQTATWTAMAAGYAVIPGQATVTDGGGPVGIDLTSVTSSGATVNTSAPFTGTVPILVMDV